MKSKILFVLFLGINLFSYGQHKCAKEIEKQIVEFADKHHNKVDVVPSRESVPGFTYHVSAEDLKNKEKLSKKFKAWLVKCPFRFYLMSSEKYQNDVVLKIYKGHNETPDSLLYKLEDKADDNKPSYIDVNLKNYAGNYKFLLKFRFREQKAGCVAFDLGMFKDHNYSFQQKD